MKPTTGLFLSPYALSHSHASSSAVPPISPIMMMPSVSGSFVKRSEKEQEEEEHAVVAAADDFASASSEREERDDTGSDRCIRITSDTHDASELRRPRPPAIDERASGPIRAQQRASLYTRRSPLPLPLSPTAAPPPRPARATDLEAVDEVGAVERIAANADDGRLAEARVGRLLDGLIPATKRRAGGGGGGARGAHSTFA